MTPRKRSISGAGGVNPPILLAPLSLKNKSMGTNDPTNGELAIMLKDLARETRESLARIEAQTSKTNGRVTSLETWKNRVIGGLIVTNIIVVPIGITLAVMRFAS